MRLKEKLLNTPLRENSGSTASNRFDYQKNWALCKLLELHAQGNDYILIFEFHDDIITLDYAEEPKTVIFYQVKTKSNGNITRNFLINRKKSKKNDEDVLLRSILGKAIENGINFKEFDKEVNIVSNTFFNIKLNDDTKSTDKYFICFADIHPDEKKIIRTKLQDELPGIDFEDIEKCTFFKVCELGLSNHNDISKIKLCEFIEKNNPECKFQPSLVYRTIFDEIKRKSNFETDINNFNDLIKYKAISKNDFDEILQVVISTQSMSKTWERIEPILSPLVPSWKELRTLKSNWNNLEIKLMNRSNNTLFVTINKIKDIISKNDSKFTSSLYECIGIVFQIYSQTKNNPLFDDGLIRAIILKELYETR